eukprot:Transcript_6752.p3 GENE.Transcript_6752~~Transcript_6752.p3  ORF type:complete len:312 (+),score=143.10 Transcript_6752:476-1411(+)
MTKEAEERRRLHEEIVAALHGRMDEAAVKAAELEAQRDAISEERTQTVQRAAAVDAEKRAAEEVAKLSRTHWEAERASMQQRVAQLEKQLEQHEATRLAGEQLRAAQEAARAQEERERSLWERNSVLEAQLQVTAKTARAAEATEERMKEVQKEQASLKNENLMLRSELKEMNKLNDDGGKATRAQVTSEVCNALLNFQGSLASGSRQSLPTYLALEAGAVSAASPPRGTPHTGGGARPDFNASLANLQSVARASGFGPEPTPHTGGALRGPSLLDKLETRAGPTIFPGPTATGLRTPVNNPSSVLGKKLT